MIKLEEDTIQEVYEEWQNHKNMSADEMREWSQNPCSREASLDPVQVMKRNLNLLETDKSDWGEEEKRAAKRAISFISRMRGMKPDEPTDGPHGCPSEWAISLLNWGFNPFDSLPEPSSETEDKLDPVDEVTLDQHRDNIKPADDLAEPVWGMKDQLGHFSRMFENYALELEKTRSEERVAQMREELASAIDLMQERVEPLISDIVDMDRELEYRGQGPAGYEYDPIPSHVLYADRGDASSRARTLGLSGVHQHYMLTGTGEDELPDDLAENVTTFYMPGDQHRDWTERTAEYSYEFSPIPQQVLYADREDAEQRATNLGLDGVHEHKLLFSDVDDVPEELQDGITEYFMAGDPHRNWVERVEGEPDIEENREASEVFHADQERGEEEDSDAVTVGPVSIQKVETEAEVSEDVDETLSEMWGDK